MLQAQIVEKVGLPQAKKNIYDTYRDRCPHLFLLQNNKNGEENIKFPSPLLALLCLFTQSLVQIYIYE